MTTPNEAPPLKPGEKIFALAFVCRQSAAFAAGMVGGAIADHAGLDLAHIVAGVVAGLIFGLLLGWVYAYIAFPTKSGKVVVVRVGRTALPKSFLVAFLPALFGAGGTAWLAGHFALAAAVSVPFLIGSAIVASILVGIFFTLAAALA